MAGRRAEFMVGVNTYHVLKFEPFLALEVLGELQKYLLGPVTRMMEAAQGDTPPPVSNGASAAPGEISADVVTGILEGIDKLSANLDGKTLVRLSKLVLNPEYIAVQIEGGDAEKLTANVVNRAFEDVGEMAQVIVEVVKINYEGFIRRSLALIGKGRASPTGKVSANSALN